MLFNEFTATKNNENEIIMNSFKPLNEKHLAKNGFIPYILVRIQEILKHKLKDQNVKFDDVAKKMKMNVFKTVIKNELKYIDLWMIEYENCFNIEYYTLRKIQGNN